MGMNVDVDADVDVDDVCHVRLAVTRNEELTITHTNGVVEDVCNVWTCDARRVAGVATASVVSAARTAAGTQFEQCGLVHSVAC